MATIDMGGKWGLLCPFLGALGPHLTQYCLGQGLPPTQWHLDPWSRLATIDMGRKLGAVPLLGGAGSPCRLKAQLNDSSNHQITYTSMWPWLRPTCMPSGILFHPAIWPQYTNITDREHRTENGSIAQGEPFYKWPPKNSAVEKETWPLKVMAQAAFHNPVQM